MAAGIRPWPACPRHRPLLLSTSPPSLPLPRLEASHLGVPCGARGVHKRCQVGGCQPLGRRQLAAFPQRQHALESVQLRAQGRGGSRRGLAPQLHDEPQRLRGGVAGQRAGSGERAGERESCPSRCATAAATPARRPPSASRSAPRRAPVQQRLSAQAAACPGWRHPAPPARCSRCREQWARKHRDGERPGEACQCYGSGALHRSAYAAKARRGVRASRRDRASAPRACRCCTHLHCWTASTLPVGPHPVLHDVLQ